MRRDRTRRRVGTTLLVSIALLVAACSSGPEDALRAEMEEAGLSATSIECFVDAFDVGSMAEIDALTEAESEAAGECLGQVFEELFTDAFAEGFEELADGDWEVSEGDVGDFPSRDDMEELAEQCRNGDNAACDDLWLVSPIDSAEEALRGELRRTIHRASHGILRVLARRLTTDRTGEPEVGRLSALCESPDQPVTCLAGWSSWHTESVGSSAASH